MELKLKGIGIGLRVTQELKGQQLPYGVSLRLPVDLLASPVFLALNVANKK